MSHRLRIIVTFFLLSFLTGCAITPLAIASWSATGVSYITTGKGIGDHIISEALQQDCAALRVVTGEPMCSPVSEMAGGPVMLAAAGASPVLGGDEWPTAGDITAVETAEPAAAPPAENEVGAQGVVVEQVAPETSPRVFTVAGSFRSIANARGRQRQIPGAVITTAQVNGDRFYRVVLDPRTTDTPALDGVDLSNTFPVSLCADTLAPPPCVVPNAEPVIAEAAEPKIVASLASRPASSPDS